MNELYFAHRIRQQLNRGAHELRPETVGRLAAARQAALACQKRALPQSVLATAASFMHVHFEHLYYKQFIAALAVVGCAVFSTFWLADQHVKELSDIDSALLSDDLPIGVYTDKGFAAWLNRASPG